MADAQRAVAVNRAGDVWTVQCHKWIGSRLAWSGYVASYRELPTAIAAAEFRQKNRLAAGQSCVIQLCAEALELTR